MLLLVSTSSACRFVVVLSVLNGTNTQLYALVWGVCFTLLLMLTMNILEQIITKPIVQTSKESNFAAWMLVPIIGCFTTGAVFLFSPSSALVSVARLQLWRRRNLYYSSFFSLFLAPEWLNSGHKLSVGRISVYILCKYS
jgi:hypothetical protein